MQLCRFCYLQMRDVFPKLMALISYDKDFDLIYFFAYFYAPSEIIKVQRQLISESILFQKFVTSQNITITKIGQSRTI